MELFGIAPLELIVVLLVAMLVLGPGRMVEMAQSIGKFWRQAQGALREMADEATIKLDWDEEDAKELAPLPKPSDSVRRPSTTIEDGASNRRRSRRAKDETRETRRRG